MALISQCAVHVYYVSMNEHPKLFEWAEKADLEILEVCQRSGRPLCPLPRIMRGTKGSLAARSEMQTVWVQPSPPPLEHTGALLQQTGKSAR